MELKEAKNKLENEGYQRKLVYKLSYMKDGTWKNAYFDDKDDAYAMIGAIQEINAKMTTYTYVTLNKWSWEMFIEP